MADIISNGESNLIDGDSFKCTIVGKIMLDKDGKRNNGLWSNADINKMKKDEIVAKLASLKLNPRGNKDEVSKRLKTYCKRRYKAITAKFGDRNRPDRFYDYLCVIDFECTCDDGKENKDTYPHEIIEFPAVLVKTTTGEVVDEFRSYCKPTINPELTQFCRYLTGITQDQVDNAPSFSKVVDDFMDFMKKHELGTKYRFAFVTDGPADFGTFLQMQFQHSSTPLPHWMRSWINLRRSYCRIFDLQQTTLAKMLADLGMEFTGRQHSGLDDARNIARIVVDLIQDGHDLLVNERLLRRDRLERAGKEASPMRDRDEPKPTTGDDEKKTTESGRTDAGKGSKSLQPDTPRPRRILPYKVLPVSKNEFLRNVYEECLTCDEKEDDDEEDDD